MGKVLQSDENLERRSNVASALERPGVVYGERYILNNRGVKLFTCQWLPAGQEAQALVFICHGYGMECSVFMKDTGERLARAGFAVYGIDYEGHGKSEGKRCYISKFFYIISDAASHFMRIQDQPKNKGKESFLYGESMGGAVALLLNRKEPSRWKGMVLVAPMAKVPRSIIILLVVSRVCNLTVDDLVPHLKIAEKMRPSPFTIAALSKLNGIVPAWQVVPVGDVFELAFKDPEKRKQIKSNKLLYHGKPRIRTALEMYRTSLDLEGRLDEVTLPFLLLHGEDDTVTDPEVSKALLDQSKSFDKTMKLYKGLWHGLTSGEAEKDIDMVFNDIIHWLSERSGTEDASSSGVNPDQHSELAVLKKASGKWEVESRSKGQHHVPLQPVHSVQAGA